jgi:hypothetical protein
VKSCIGLWCCTCLFFIAGSERTSAQDIRIYEPASAWETPELVSAPEGSLLFSDPAGRYCRNRSFYYTGLTSDGASWTVQLFHWRYAWLDTWGAAIVVCDPDGRCFVHEGKIPERDVVDSRETLSIRFGDNRFENDGPLSRIVLRAGEFQCDLAMRPVLPPWIPGDGYAMLVGGDDIYMRKAVPIPLAETSGVLHVGTRTIPANGWSYGDRSLIVAPLRGLNSSGCAFRVFSRQVPDGEEPWSLALLDYASVGGMEGLRIPMLLVTHGGEWILTSKDYRITCGDLVRDAATSISYPRRIHLSAASRGYSLDGDFLLDRLIHTTDVFEHIPGLVRGIVSVFLQPPIVFRMVGHFSGTLAGPDGTVENLLLAGQGEYFTGR